MAISTGCVNAIRPVQIDSELTIGQDGRDSPSWPHRAAGHGPSSVSTMILETPPGPQNPDLSPQFLEFHILPACRGEHERVWAKQDNTRIALAIWVKSFHSKGPESA